MTPVRFAKTSALLLLLSSATFASRVLKVDGPGKMAAISQNSEAPWRARDYACVVRDGREVACGVIVKVSSKGAILRFDYKSGNPIRSGDSVEVSTDAREARGASSAGRRTLANDDAPDTTTAVKRDAPVVEEPPRRRSDEPQVVDLSKMNEPDDKSGKLSKNRGRVSTGPIEQPVEQAMGPHGNVAPNQPHFQVLYDWLLTYQPGIKPPLTFDSYHQLLLLEIYPDPSLYFGFEVSQNPRYFELDYSITSRVTLRFGRIYIPFDDLSPHSYFGGRANVARLIPLNGTAFLPDIWTDLGLGVKVELFNRPYASAEFHAYVVNGFGDAGARDPMSQATSYPQFGSIPLTDNNKDKAMGARLHASLLRNHIGIGASFYRGRYSSQNQDPAGMIIFGLDGQLRYGGTEFRAGYAYMNVGLTQSLGNMLRAGYYGELGQSFGKWTVRARMGQVQNDNRVVAVTDQTIVGGAIIYKPGPVQLSFEYNRDLNQVATKTNYDYAAFRVVMAF
jgi:hypothetical protein